MGEGALLAKHCFASARTHSRQRLGRAPEGDLQRPPQSDPPRHPTDSTLLPLPLPLLQAGAGRSPAEHPLPQLAVLAATPVVTGMRLRFVYRRTGPSLLVADNVRISKAGRVRENITRHKDGRVSSRLQGRATAVIFLAVPQVKLPKRLDLARDAHAAENALPGMIVANWTETRS